MKKITLTLLAANAFFSASLSAETPIFDALMGKKGEWTSARFSEAVTVHSPTLRKERTRILTAKSEAKRATIVMWPRLILMARYTRLSEVENDPLFSIPVNPDAENLLRGVDDPEAQMLWIGLGQQNQALSKQGIEIPLNQWVFDAELQVPLSDFFLTMNPARQSALLKTDAERAKVRAAEDYIRFQSRLLFYGLMRSRAVIALQRERLKEAEERLRIIKEAKRLGAAKESDLLRIESYVFLVKANLENALSTETALLERARGLAGVEQRFEIGENVLADLPKITETAETLLSSALSNRAENEALLYALDALDAGSVATTRTGWPQMFLVSKFTFANPNTRYMPMKEEFDATWEASAIVKWSPNEIFLGASRTAKLDAKKIKVLAEKEEFETSLRSELVATLGEDRSNQLLIHAARSAMRAAEEGYRLKKIEYDAGTTTLSELLATERELAQARMGTIDARIQARMTRSKLNWLTHGRISAPQ